MIKPDRHTNPDISVINISAFILKQLNTFYDISYDELLKKVVTCLLLPFNFVSPSQINL